MATTYIDRISPSGFHVLTESEALAIIDVLGGDAAAGDKLKESGTEHWDSPNAGTNESLLTVLGGGDRDIVDGSFDNYRKVANIWLANEGTTGNAKALQLANDSAAITAIEQLKGKGLSVRLAMDNPELFIPGMTMGDADGNVYDLVRVYRAGVPLVINYGGLYNWYAVTDARGFTSSDTWEVPETTDYRTMLLYLGGTEMSGACGLVDYNKLKESGITYWNLGNGTNETGFNSRGSGGRNGLDGSFAGLKGFAYYHVRDKSISEGTEYLTFFQVDEATLNAAFIYYAMPLLSFQNDSGSVRLVRPATEAELLLEDGTACALYVQNNGIEVSTVKIGTQVWMSANSCETKFRDGSYIPGFDGGVYTPISDVAWAALTSAAMCFYGDTPANAYTLTPEVNIVLTKQNLATTKYNDGTPILQKQEDADWISDTVGAYCQYDDAVVIDIPPVISGEESAWFNHSRLMGLVAEINPNNLLTTVKVQYGTTNAYGTDIVLENIAAGITTNQVRTLRMPELTPGTYHWRIVAENSAGAVNGQDQVFEVYPGTTRERTEYTIETMAGLTYYIDPDSATNGIGTITDPMNAFPSTLGNSRKYLQLVGTTATFSTEFSTITGPCTIGSYGVGTRPVIYYSGSNSSDNFRFIRSDYKIIIRDIQISRAGITGVGVYLVNAPGSTAYNCEISGFSVPIYTQGGGSGLNLQWTGVKVLYCDIHGCGSDGLYFRYTTGIEVGHCYIYDVNRNYLVSGQESETDSPGDNIQAATAGGLYLNVHHCTLDHSTTGNKFNIIVASDSSMLDSKYNHLIGTKQFAGHPVSGIYLGSPCATANIFGNIFEDHNLGIWNSGMNTIVNYNLFINSNKCISTVNNRFLTAYNNVFYNYALVAIERLSGAYLAAKNNVFKATGLAFNLSGVGTDNIDFNHFDGMAAVGTNASVNDSRFEDVTVLNFYPLTGSPLINSGANVGLTTDFNLQVVSSPPSKGIYE